jgi:hypothetical protein
MALMVGGWCAHSRARSHAVVVDVVEPAGSTLCRYVGSVSCAAAACHNAGGATGTKGSEYSTWLVRDPHARASAALFDERSLRIERNLQHLARGARPHPGQDSLCLRCHATTDEPAGEVQHVTRTDGVGCEACHGPAERWLGEHYTLDWRQKDASEKAELGMRPTKDLLVRARVCVDCHVGGPDRQVDHDLIAAGHPRLQFEYGAYMAVLPKHWSVWEEKARYPDFEARAWRLGQVVSLEASLRLLAFRALADGQGGRPARPWPEFSDYSCLACHHNLEAGAAALREPPIPLQTKGTNARPARTLLVPHPYPTTFLSALATQPGREGARAPEIQGLIEQLSSLQTLMEGPDRKQVAQSAQEAAEKLQPWVHRCAAEALDLVTVKAALVRTALESVAPRGLPSWESAAQLYFALAALYHAAVDLDPGARDPELQHLIEQLGRLVESQYPEKKGSRGPSLGYEETRVQMQQTLERIRQRVRQTDEKHDRS